MAFKKWANVPEVMQEVEKLSALAEQYNALLATKKTEDKIAAQKIWQSMASSYWDILFAIIDASTKSNPAVLAFDSEERLFIDLGYIPGILNMSKNFDSKKFLTSKCTGGIMPVMTFSDYIAESWSSITGNNVPVPSIGMSLDERIAYLQDELVKAQKKRNDFLVAIAKMYEPGTNSGQLASSMNNFLISAMKVNMRVPEYREGSESFRQNLSKERKAYNDSENAVIMMINSAGKKAENPLSPMQAEKFMQFHEMTKVIAKEILYSQIDAVKIARRAKKITDSCAEMSPQMRRGELKNMLVKKRDYLTVPAKNARADTSLICQPESNPIDYAANYAILESMCRMDIDMFNVPRVRMYGIPRAIFVPGQGLGTYDWSDHTLLIPVFPIGGEDKSVSYAVGTFRWDSDEDRRFKTPYENIKENKKKSLLALAQSFYKDYSLWMTKEKKGYRILPGETHKAFVDMFRPRPEE